MDKQKQEFIEKIKRCYNKDEDLVHYIDQVHNSLWSTEKNLSQLNDLELDQVNLRKSLPNEVILDIEEKHKLEAIENKLIEKAWSYRIWDTGSRGYHISIIFANLGDLPLELRNRLRKYIISEFGTDDKLAKESQWLALEWAKHMKTGNQKTMFREEGDSINYIPTEIIEYCTKMLEFEKGSKEAIKQEQDADFKDFLNDPYLKYVLSHQITDGNRNDVLFKNFAIGLVKAGLNKNEIEQVAQAIVSNCPGKTLGEFMGWVEKALLCEITEYNKNEIILWAAKYNHPIMYETVGTLEEENFMDIKTLWDAIWNYNIAAQPVWRDLAFYNMIGTIIDERKEDYRIHLIFTSYSGTGKDEGINLIEKTLKKLKVPTSRPSEITDRALIGSANQYNIEFNTKHQLSPEDPDHGKYKYRDPVEIGDLGKCLWMAFGEGETVFNPGQFNRKIQLYLRQAMDKNRTIEKGVNNFKVNLFTNTSFVITTFMLNNGVYKILNNGLFQRTLYYNKELTEEEHAKILNHIIERRFNNDIRTKFDEEKYFALMVDKLSKMKLWYKENKDKIQYFSNSSKYIENLWKKYQRSYESLPKLDKMILDSVVRRSSTILHKLCILNATWKQKTELSMEDVNECFAIIQHCLESLKTIIMQFDSVNKQLASALYIIKSKGGSVAISTFYADLEDQIGAKSSATKVKIFNKLKNLKYVTECEIGTKKTIALTDTGRDLLEE